MNRLIYITAKAATIACVLNCTVHFLQGRAIVASLLVLGFLLAFWYRYHARRLNGPFV